jgi:cytochrome c oxidase subunit IV
VSRTYWLAWGSLLTLTLLMIGIDQAPLPRTTLVLLMLTVMAAKACVIGAYFMHLRFERWPLVLGIVVGLPLNAVILFTLIVPDALRIFGMVAHR